MRIVKSGLLYFAIVFGTGFVLGIIRTLWVVPSTGARTAELIEMPFMLVATILAAKFVVRRLSDPPTLMTRIGIGLVALIAMLSTEFTVVLWLREMSVREYLATRDPVSGSLYYAMLLIFVFMPLFVPMKPTHRYHATKLFNSTPAA